MDAPAAKKRKLAPKAPAAQPQPTFHEPQAQQFQVQEVAPPLPPPERHDFESFARHLQDAAMLIYGQSQKLPYPSVSVLILRWEDDNDVEQDLGILEQVLRERYNYCIERWNIPSVPGASIKLSVRIQSFLESAEPDHLLILYYAGHGSTGSDNQVSWASNAKQDAVKVKWNGVRCLLEDSKSDILALLDTCIPRSTGPTASGSSVRDIIAASDSEHHHRVMSGRSFTAHVTDAFMRLSTGRPFSTDSLYQEIATQRHQELLQGLALTNGAAKNISLVDQLPLLYRLSSGHRHSIRLSPLLIQSSNNLQSSRLEVDGDATQQSSGLRENELIHPNAVADLTFDEPRVLVCTTFVGEASPDMSSFNSWLQHPPAVASKIAVEGMFVGPPTMLLISMPVTVWNVVQHDKVCCFLGSINSHNMTHLYKHLISSVTPSLTSERDMEDGRILLEAREVAATTPIIRRIDFAQRDPNLVHLQPETPARPDGIVIPQASIPAGQAYPDATPGAIVKADDVEDSAEMQEAAEQLKALSHVRHMNEQIVASGHGQTSQVDRAADVKHDDNSSHEVTESGLEEPQQSTPTSRPKQRRSLTKSVLKQETRCDLCSHAPFKDSSSLRKHVAAAHTRPFPCAFAFAGCASTFGSKNEWKRHIASQHLCLQYYRCSSCPQSAVEGKGNEFNRKDLFTQHLRRMHAPFAIKKALAKGDSKLQQEWESHVKEMQSSCLVTRRQPPQRSACPKPDCASVFEGPTSWDEWTEHVGRHMEKGEAARLGVDRLLAKWALDEGIIERKDDGEYRLCSGNSIGGDKGSSDNHNTYNLSDGNRGGSEEKTIIAASTIVEPMDVDG